MTLEQKREILGDISRVLDNFIDSKPERKTFYTEIPVELLTIKECAEEISGLSVTTIREFIAQGKIPVIRSGKGRCGKILINKADLLDFLRNST